MPNPTSKLNLVINGVTTQLDIHDANAVDLTSNQTVAGNKEFTGTTTAHDLVPSATDTYNFGSPTAQWNNAYIKSLTINGVACGDILTHNASEFVDVSSNQTIDGNKTFSGSFSLNKPSPRLQTKSTTYSSETSSGMTIGEIAFLNNTGGFSAWIVHQLRDDLTKRLCFRVYPHTSTTYRGFVFDDNCNLYPENTNSALGTSTNKWKSFNGINPGALSLPSISSTGANAWIALDTTDWIKSAVTSIAQKYTPPADGWLNIRVDNATMLGLAITGVNTNYMHQMVRSETPSGLALLMPVFKNTEVAILVGGNENLSYSRATFYYCQGNV